MRMSSIVCIIGWLAFCLSLKGAVLLDLGRFLTGCGIGVLSYVACLCFFLIASLLSQGLMTQLGLLAGIVPCIVQLLGLSFIPESPRWLPKVGRQREFEAALRIFCGDDADISQEEAEIQDYIANLQLLPKVTITGFISEEILSFSHCKHLPLT
ncbi:hypothetical protein HHK36_020687 [Tetracentron sinense]|uniref:Uncharacterized protein n=1 Tax=Tetracentron sinense TaxID=13715 RepID=A0A834YS19_TETSI|nr:hypothetical protein HHK36_020687 [Tetracentron sinense]